MFELPTPHFCVIGGQQKTFSLSLFPCFRIFLKTLICTPLEEQHIFDPKELNIMVFLQNSYITYFNRWHCNESHMFKSSYIFFYRGDNPDTNNFLNIS